MLYEYKNAPVEDIKNKGFTEIDTLFKENGWKLIKNDFDWITYNKFGHETECFEINIDKTTISVSIPLKNLPYQYVTQFSDYFRACEYIEARFKEFTELFNEP